MAGVENPLEFSSSLHGKCFCRSQPQGWEPMNRMHLKGTQEPHPTSREPEMPKCSVAIDPILDDTCYHVDGACILLGS